MLGVLPIYEEKLHGCFAALYGETAKKSVKRFCGARAGFYAAELFVLAVYPNGDRLFVGSIVVHAAGATYHLRSLEGTKKNAARAAYVDTAVSTRASWCFEPVGGRQENCFVLHSAKKRF